MQRAAVVWAFAATRRPCLSKAPSIPFVTYALSLVRADLEAKGSLECCLIRHEEE